MSRSTKLLDLFNRKRPARAPARRVPMLEPLEPRLLLSTTLFLDFGAGVGMAGTIDTTPGLFSDIFGAGTGTELTDNPGTAPGENDTLRLTPLQYDFNLDGFTNNADLVALANSIVPLVQRSLEPFDILIQVASATGLADAVTSVGANALDPTGEFDAYVFVMQASSDFGGAVFSNAVAPGLFGEAAGNDLNLQGGNTQDEAALAFADNIFNSILGVAPGTAAFNANLAQRIAYTATHEAFHTFSYAHTPDEQGDAPQASNNQRLLASGDVIRRGSQTRDDAFIVTRYDLQHWRGTGSNAVAEPNNYLLAANDTDIGLRDSDGDGTPDLAYVTGTGAHDLITLTDDGGGNVDVFVNPFSNQTRTISISSESYSIDLSTETEGEILLDASINADEVRVDARIDADFRLRGGEGFDNSFGAAADQDLLTLQANGLTGTFTPGGDEAGTVVYAGGATIDYSEFEDVEADGIPIDVAALELSSANLDEGDVLTLSGSFVNIDTLDLHEVVISWGDGSADTILSLLAGVREFSAMHTYRDDNPTGTASDGYHITVTVSDGDDGTGMAEADVTVHNVAPEITNISFSEEEIDEADMVTVTGTFADPALGVDTETFTGTALWSDGVATALAIDGDAGTFTTSRTFLDDHPMTGTPSDAFTITITIEDDDLGSDVEESAALIVNNVDPVIQAFQSDATFEDKGEEGEPVTVTGSFTDIGILDTHVATVDWGDGTVEDVDLTQGAGFGTIEGSHAYAAGGIYTVTLTITDDDTGTHQATTLAVITGVGLNNGVLYVIGSEEDDQAHIHQTGRGFIKVHASFIDEPFREFAIDEVDEILSYLCQGDDRLTIAGNVETPAIVHGDGGNDHLHGGGGPSVLIGGSGDDTLIGQRGANILIGGTGRDRLVGGPAGDILIGGSTTFDHNQDAELAAAVLLWVDPLASYEDRANAVDAHLTVADDGDPDMLTGASGIDLFYSGLGDIALDRKSYELDGPAPFAFVTLGASPTVDWTGSYSGKKTPPGQAKK